MILKLVKRCPMLLRLALWCQDHLLPVAARMTNLKLHISILRMSNWESQFGDSAFYWKILVPFDSPLVRNVALLLEQEAAATLGYSAYNEASSASIRTNNPGERIQISLCQSIPGAAFKESHISSF
ncbi:hypothetical protein ACP4OV_016581 [Aristida adscensionis]